MTDVDARRVSVRGVVQGVGFRPFVYRLANELQLSGWVCNTSGDVTIVIEGENTKLDLFLSRLEKEAPPQSHIESIVVTPEKRDNFQKFEIRHSVIDEKQYQLVSPDIAMCEDCRHELFDITNRRYRYAFTNCTNCGPRFTIIEDIPYDRPRTTMKKFVMCPDCRQEYEDPADRRFHAQPNACPVCGPRLQLVNNRGEPMPDGDVIRQASSLLKEGKILAVKGLGGFQLACDATSETAVETLRTRKMRPAKPFAVMFSGIEQMREHCLLDMAEIKLLKSSSAPIVLTKWRKGSSNIVDSVAPANNYLGVMLPYTPLHHLLMEEVRIPLVMTSGNLSEEPIAKDNDEALRRLKTIADYFILHDREIYARYDDSVYIVEEGKTQSVRRARGYAPYPIFLPCNVKSVLACGAEEKNTFCITKDDHAFLSQHIGDLENEETLEHFETTVDLYIKLFRLNPELIAFDMHPDYLSTGYARRLSSHANIPAVPVQHHHAHIVSCMVENKINRPVIGVAFDGTGYGSDGAVWGGEFLVADWHSFKRAGHLQYIPMPGGSAAIKKPYRMALGYLYTLLGSDIKLDKLPLSKFYSPEFEVIKQMLVKKINAPMTSSAGRLFDAVSALLGVCGEVSYSAQGAIELEMLAENTTAKNDFYPATIEMRSDIRIIMLADMISTIIQDIYRGMGAGEISMKFHLSMAEMITRMCGLISKDTGINEIILSGGVFQNRVLQRLALAALRKAGYNVFIHYIVPCNDGGISLGQAVAAGVNI